MQTASEIASYICYDLAIYIYIKVVLNVRVSQMHIFPNLERQQLNYILFQILEYIAIDINLS